MGIEPWQLPIVFYVECDVDGCGNGTEPEKDVDSRGQAAADALAAGWKRSGQQWFCPEHAGAAPQRDPKGVDCG